METINAIEVKGLWAAYEDRMIIEDMNLKIPKGKSRSSSVQTAVENPRC